MSFSGSKPEATSAFEHFAKPGQEFKGHKADFSDFHKEVKTCIRAISREYGVQYLFGDWEVAGAPGTYGFPPEYQLLNVVDPTAPLLHPGTDYPIFVQLSQPQAVAVKQPVIGAPAVQQPPNVGRRQT